jgi:uncharacterized protein (DUF488 family)
MTIYTVSYEGRSLEGFLTDLRAQAVQLVVDVREAPISRKRGFSKSALSAALEGAGIGYRHMRPLGCPKPIRDAYKRDGDWDRYTQAFMAHLREQESAIAELASLSSAQSAALLCFEADFTRCHRTYVAQAVAERTGAPVRHIEGPGNAPVSHRRRRTNAV